MFISTVALFEQWLNKNYFKNRARENRKQEILWPSFYKKQYWAGLSKVAPDSSRRISHNTFEGVFYRFTFNKQVYCRSMDLYTTLDPAAGECSRPPLLGFLCSPSPASSWGWTTSSTTLQNTCLWLLTNSPASSPFCWWSQSENSREGYQLHDDI